MARPMRLADNALYSTLTPRGQRTRAALVRAARTVFEEKGYEDCRVVDITTEAQAAYGTFYTYFDSKESIFAEVVDELIVDFKAISRAEPDVGHSPAARIERANRGYLRAYRKNARMMTLLEHTATFNAALRDVRVAARRYWVERSRRAIRQWQAQGLVDPAIDPAYAATALGSMVDRSAYVWIVLGEPYDEETAVRQLTLLYCRALGLDYGSGRQSG